MREIIADLMHKRWVHWMNYLFQVSTENSDGGFTIPRDKVARWKRQMSTSYQHLPLDEQKSDIQEADCLLDSLSSVNFAVVQLDQQPMLFNDLTAASVENMNTLFEQYKLYVELSDKVSERRHQANSFFLTANSILVTALTALVGFNQEFAATLSWLIFPCVAGLAFCLTWRQLIRSYKQLNEGKFKVIHILERRLPAQLFFAEWELLNRGDGSLYTPFTKYELSIPVVFAVIYTVLAVLSINQML